MNWLNCVKVTFTNQKHSPIQVIKKWESIHILFASYGYTQYYGNAWVLFEQDGRFFEVNGGHCLCYGLEGQWKPKEVVLEELEHRLTNGIFGVETHANNIFKTELCSFLGIEI